MNCSAKGRPAPTYEWYFNSTELKERTALLHIYNISRHQAGNYTCVAKVEYEEIYTARHEFFVDVKCKFLKKFLTVYLYSYNTRFCFLQTNVDSFVKIVITDCIHAI